MSDKTLGLPPGGRILREFGFMRLARITGLNPAGIRKWSFTQIPAERVPVLCRIMRVRPHDLRPDLWGPTDRGPPLNTRRGGRNTNDTGEIARPEASDAGREPAL